MARNGINKREFDKWAKGLVKEANKSLERAARRNPSRVPVQFETTTTVGGALDGGAIESSPNLAGLLMWLDAYAQQHPGEYADVARFVEEHESTEDASVLAFQLEQRGLADLTRTWSDAAPHVHLTDEGRVTVHTLKRLQTDRAARLRHTMDAFLRWLYDIAGDQAPTDPSLFLSTPGSFFAGVEIAQADLQQALVHLAENDLIEPAGADPVTVAITTQGVSCALSGGSVQDHTNQQRPGTTYNNFLPNAQGVIIGEQENVTQNNTAGIDPSAFVQLAGYVGQISNTLGMPETDRVELERVAQELHDEATSPNPEPGRMQQFTSRVKTMLVEAGATAAAQVGIQMAEQALGTLG
ncbi:MULTISPECIES: hypothetical protein [Streptomyces]|uniref:hypothetical protein n=1 Tax=Streptomyces TaxID=1883 RepID=UPI00240E1A7E|nr:MULTISPECIES: hypothetical protein [Streptomyces]WFB83746.1 hypothetical protein MMU79_10705 [Streptomyces olivaceus]WGK50636.1 hypothetical protein M6G09_36300 [Streptomyces sp. B146]